MRRCTTKPGKLFIHVFKWTPGSFELPAVSGKIQKAYFLSDPARKQVNVQQESSRVVITLPQEAPDKMDTVLVLEVS